MLFPLLVLLDSLLAARPPKQPPPPNADNAAPSATPVFAAAMRTDRAAEAMLEAMHRLLRRCAEQEPGPPALPLLQRLVPLLQLPRGQVSEEVRLHGVRCVDAALALVNAEQASTLCSEDAAPLLGSMIAGLLRCVHVLVDQYL